MRKAYGIVREIYKEIGVDTEAAIERLSKIQISLQCWQGDDIKGFLFKDQELTGGISVTGNYSNRATNIDELKSDISFALTMIPGSHKLNLHAIYLDTDEVVDLDEIKPKHYSSWVEFAKKEKIGLDFNPTCFSHPKSEDGFTLSSPNPEIQDFWIKHVQKSREVGAYFTKELGQKSVVNLWIPDGFKDNPYDRITPRIRLKEALDKIYQKPLDVVDTLESKLFGIGTEAYTVGSHDFYLSYALGNKLGICLDSGHFHPTESVADKIASLSMFDLPILLHLSRPMRWDSDHVVIMDDEINKIAEVIIRNNLDDRIQIGFDFFDASISRVGAWIIGTRSFQMALLKAILEPTEMLKKAELTGDYTKRLYYTEMLKGLPFGIVYDEYLRRDGKPSQDNWFEQLKLYEDKLKR